MKKTALALILALLMCNLFTACGCSESKTSARTAAEEEIHLAVILGSHANAPSPNLALIESEVYDACLSFGSVSLIVDDGDPYAKTIDIPVQKDNLTDTKASSIAASQTKQILEVAAGLAAKTPEVDTLKAMQMAARQLNGAASDRSGITVVRKAAVLDSCLPTAGTLNCTNADLTALDPEKVADQLEELGELPTFTVSVDVALYSVGDVAEPQPALSENARQKLCAVWQAVLEKGGAAVSVHDDLPAAGGKDDLPSVSVVEVSSASVDLTSMESVAKAMKEGTAIRLSEEAIGFLPGSAELKDKAAAETILGQVAACLKENPDQTLLVVGTTAHSDGDKTWHQELSESRADAVVSLLTAQGVRSDHLTAMGVGWWSHLYQNDQTTDGRLDEALAAQNRSVYLIVPDSDDGRKLLSEP